MFQPGDRVECRAGGLYRGTVALIDAEGMLYVFSDGRLRYWAKPHIMVHL